MKLVFLGTRGNIDARTRRHRMHTSLLVAYRTSWVVIDCGTDWLGKIERLHPSAIVITHAHPDHVGGLKGGAPCPVHASREAWQVLDEYGVRERRLIWPRIAADICGMTFEAFPVEHSLRAPAVGYRISTGVVCFFYVPDLVSIHDRVVALSGVRLYVGDGATLVRPLVQKRGEALIGHASIRSQLEWCKEAGVPWAVFTHCGSQLVSGDEQALEARVHEMGRDLGVRAQIAHDGMEVVLRQRLAAS